MRIGILTVSDTVASGQSEDRGGPVVRSLLDREGWTVDHYSVVADERREIESTLRRWADSEGLDVVFTTGGTGLGPRDVTPEATAAVAHRNVPGIAEMIRAGSMRHTESAMLSRGVACLRGRTLIINLPGNPKGAIESVEVVLPILDHAVSTMHGSRH